MPQAKASIAELQSLKTTLKKAWSDIVDVKLRADYFCYCFDWNDEAGRRFVERYEKQIEPIKEKLLRAIDRYVDYLDRLIDSIRVYNDVSSLNPIVDGRNDPRFLPYEECYGHEGSSACPIVDEPPLQPLPMENIDGTIGFWDADFNDRLEGMQTNDLQSLEQIYKDYVDLAGLADCAYQEGAPLPEGWEDVGLQDEKIHRILEDIRKEGGDDAGFKVSVFRQQGTDRYVVAFGGTDFPKDWSDTAQLGAFYKDASTDVVGAVSSDEEQIKLAKTAVQRLVKQGGVPLSDMEFTGHSLGGRLAAETSVRYGRLATTFNAAGVCEETRIQYDYLTQHSRSYLGVRNVVAEHDFLTTVQSTVSGLSNPYVAALPKEEIKIMHETLSGTLSSDEGTVAMKALDASGPLGASVGHVIQGLDTAATAANAFNEVYNRDYRALGGTLVLPDGQDGISFDSHRLGVVKGLLEQRHKMITNRLSQP